MVSKFEKAISLDEMDVQAVEAANVPIPRQPMTPYEAAKFADELLDALVEVSYLPTTSPVSEDEAIARAIHAERETRALLSVRHDVIRELPAADYQNYLAENQPR